MRSARVGSRRVNAVRFIEQYEVGQSDYTRERAAFLPDWDAETLVKRTLGSAVGTADRAAFGYLVRPCHGSFTAWWRQSVPRGSVSPMGLA